MMGLCYYMLDKKPKFGALKASDTLTTMQQSQVVSETLQLDWIRSRIVLSTWSGSASVIDNNISLGLKQLIVLVCYPTGSAQPWFTDIPTLTATLESVYTKYKNQLTTVICDNEELNNNYHSGTDAEYCTFVQTVHNVLHKYGIKVANGGFGNNIAINMNVYRWAQTKYNQAAADVYGQSMTSGQVNAAKNPGSNPTFEALANRLLTVMNGCKGYIDYVDCHGYEPFDNRTLTPQDSLAITPNIWRYKKEYFETVWKVPMISNEMGQGSQNSHPELTGSIIDEVHRLGFEHSQWYDGYSDTGVQARPLTADAYPSSLLSTGTTYFTKVQALK